MRTSYLIPSLVILALASGGPAWAQRVGTLPAMGAMPAPEAPLPPAEASSQPQDPTLFEGIVAVVNDGIVTTADLRGRMGLALLSASLPNVAEVRAKMLPQVMRGLVDEQLQLQKAASLGISIPDAEIDATMKRLGTENKIPGGDMAPFLAANGVPPEALRAQIRAGLAWGKVIQRDVRPRVDVGDDEVEAALQRIRADAGKQEYLVSEIYLTVDNPADEDQVRGLAEKLVEQLKNGAVFGAVARQFSQGTGAATGGDMGWVQRGQLGAEIDRELGTMQPGEVVGPVRTANGFHILGLREKRTIALGDPADAKVALKQAFRPFGEQTAKESLMREVEELRQRVKGCEDLDVVVPRDFPAWRVTDLGDVLMRDAPEWLADKVKDLGEGQTSEAMATDKGALVLFVCGREMPDSINRQDIFNAIGQEKMELAARRLMRDLRRSAHIDMRMKAN